MLLAALDGPHDGLERGRRLHRGEDERGVDDRPPARPVILPEGEVVDDLDEAGCDRLALPEDLVDGFPGQAVLVDEEPLEQGVIHRDI